MLSAVISTLILILPCFGTTKDGPCERDLSSATYVIPGPAPGGAVVREWLSLAEGLRLSLSALRLGTDGATLELNGPRAALVEFANALGVDVHVALAPARVESPPTANLDALIIELDVGLATARLLHAAGVLNVRDLVQFTPASLRHVPRLGEARVRELEAALTARGLAFGAEVFGLTASPPTLPYAKVEETRRLNRADPAARRAFLGRKLAELPISRAAAFAPEFRNVTVDQVLEDWPAHAREAHRSNVLAVLELYGEAPRQRTRH